MARADSIGSDGLKEQVMDTTKVSLRYQVEKWLMMASAMSARVSRANRAGSNERRCVCVEALRSTGPIAIYFFCEGEGNWCVSPLRSDRPTMRVA